MLTQAFLDCLNETYIVAPRASNGYRVDRFVGFRSRQVEHKHQSEICEISIRMCSLGKLV